MIRSLMTTVQLESPTETGGTRLRMQKLLREKATTNGSGRHSR
jgi:hypothetical protein